MSFFEILIKLLVSIEMLIISIEMLIKSVMGGAINIKTISQHACRNGVDHMILTMSSKLAF